jgi:deoxycitidine kinase
MCVAQWHTMMLESLGEKLHLSGIIYLRTKPETCFERLQRRARSEEATVPLDYLQSLHQRHEDWLLHQKPSLNLHASLKDTPVLIIDSDLEFETDAVVRELGTAQRVVCRSRMSTGECSGAKR